MPTRCISKQYFLFDILSEIVSFLRDFEKLKEKSLHGFKEHIQKIEKCTAQLLVSRGQKKWPVSSQPLPPFQPSFPPWAWTQKPESPANNIPPGEPSAPNKNHYGVLGRVRRQLALCTCDPCHFFDLTLVTVIKACRGAAVTGKLNTAISANRNSLWASVPVVTGSISSGFKKKKKKKIYIFLRDNEVYGGREFKHNGLLYYLQI